MIIIWRIFQFSLTAFFQNPISDVPIVLLSVTDGSPERFANNHESCSTCNVIANFLLRYFSEVQSKSFVVLATFWLIVTLRWSFVRSEWKIDSLKRTIVLQTFRDSVYRVSLNSDILSCPIISRFRSIFLVLMYTKFNRRIRFSA